MDSESVYFRAGVGALVVGPDGRFIAFQRSKGGTPEWQMPQGGLLDGEEPVAAVLREILEETSIPGARLQLVDEAEEWIGYELPEAYRSEKTGRGQVQKWFLLRFSGADQDVRPDGSEFSAWQWMTPAQLLAATVPFRRAVYQRVFERFAAHLAKG
jgi:putative (di)nucleoside polyphosphate hydrolase